MRTGRNPGTAGITKDARANGKDKACLSREQVVILNNWRGGNDWGEAIYCSSEDAIDVDFWTVVVVERRPSLRLERGRKKEQGM